MRETDLNADIDIIVDGLIVKQTCYRRKPLNLKILKQFFGDQSVDYSIELTKEKNELKSVKYRFLVNRLPGEIDPYKTQISVLKFFLIILFLILIQSFFILKKN